MSTTTSTATSSTGGTQPSSGGNPGGGRPLTNEAVFRIEVSLSSRKSSAIVMKTQARLYSLESSQEPSSPVGTSNVQWKSVAYGAPCIQLMRETTEHNSPFHIKVVIAEVESGITLWEAEVSDSSGYNAMQTNFHTFSSNGRTFAVQFANDVEAQRMLESIHDLFLQKQRAETVVFDKKPNETIFKKPKSFKRLSKKDISVPCNFKHVSGITVQRTQTCEDELRGTIQRKMRSMSLSNLTTRKVKPRAKQSDEMVDGGVYRDTASRVGISPAIGRKGGDSTRSRSGSILNKFGSLKISRKKAYAVNGEGAPNPQDSQTQFVREDNRMSLPTHFRRQTRPPLNANTFTQGPSPDRGPTDRRSPSRSLSLSSDDLVVKPAGSKRHPSGSTLERRHTIVVDHQSPSRRPNPYNYVPYSMNMAGGRAAHPPAQGQLGPRQFSSDVQLNRSHPAAYYGAGHQQVNRRTSLAEMQIIPMDGGNKGRQPHNGMSTSASHTGIYPSGAPGRQYFGQRPGVTSNPVVVRVPSNGGIPAPAQLALKQRYTQAQNPAAGHYQVPSSTQGKTSVYQTPSNPQVTYQTPSNGQPNYPLPNNSQQMYQTPTKRASGAPLNSDIHYQVPASQSKSDFVSKGGNPIPYAVVGVGNITSQPKIAGQMTSSGTVMSGAHSTNTVSSVPQPVLNGGGLPMQPPHSPTHVTIPPHGRPREVVQLSPTQPQATYDLLNPRDRPLPLTPEEQMVQQRNKYHNMNLRKQPVVKSVTPEPHIKETSPSLQAQNGHPDVQVSPSHTRSKVAPVPLQTPLHGQQAFTSNDPPRETSPNAAKFQPDSREPYDTLPAADGNQNAGDSLASHSSTSVSTQDNFTDKMAKALEQFDSLLQPTQQKKQIMQTSL